MRSSRGSGWVGGVAASTAACTAQKRSGRWLDGGVGLGSRVVGMGHVQRGWGGADSCVHCTGRGGGWLGEREGSADGVAGMR
eukprot:363284-Chlamydomonas_euryale.AAC.10